jgi:hypothetical protein
MGGDNIIESCPRRSHEIAHLFGITFVSESGETAKIREQDRDLFALAGWIGKRV